MISRRCCLDSQHDNGAEGGRASTWVEWRHAKTNIPRPSLAERVVPVAT